MQAWHGTERLGETGIGNAGEATLGYPRVRRTWQARCGLARTGQEAHGKTMQERQRTDRPG